MRIGIDVGGSHIGLGLVNKDGKLVLKDEKDCFVSINPMRIGSDSFAVRCGRRYTRAHKQLLCQ